MIRVHYGKEMLELPIPADNLAFNLFPKKVSGTDNEQEVIEQALQRPIGCGRLCELVPSDASVVIIADDRTRMTPQDRIIPQVLNELYAAGVTKKHIRIIIAYGTHRRMSDSEVELKFGRKITSTVEIRHHDCLDQSKLLDMGLTRRGTRIFVNRECMEADIRIGIGSVVPHYPTGWSGGAKILLPGLAGEETTYAMHLLGITETSLGQEVSPVREEMEDFAREVGLHFIVNVIHDDHGRVVHAVSGHFIKAHREAVRLGRDMYSAVYREKADITLSSPYPIDYDLTQSSKGLFSAELATKPGGEIILLSPCSEGIAPTHGDEMLRLGLYDNDRIRYMLDKRQISDPLSATECMYYNLVKDKFRTVLMMDSDLSRRLGFNHISPDALPGYIARRLEENRGLKIGVLNQSAELLPTAQ